MGCAFAATYTHTHARSRAFKLNTGSLFCPVYNSLEGPFAASPKTVAEQLAFEEDSKTYPFCPSLDDNDDLLVVSEYSAAWKRCN